MKSPLFFILFSLILLGTIIGCSGSGGGGNNGGGNPNNKEEALSKLSPAHKRSFEAWQTKVVKSCDPSAAFGLSKDKELEAYGVDGAALIKQNGGSLVFSDNDNLLVVTSYNSFSGTGTTKVEETQQVNGQGYNISAETKREGSSCTVFLFGQKVFETHIAESFTVGTQWTPGKKAKSTSSRPQIRRLGATGASEVTQTGFYKLISQTFKPTQDSVALLSGKLGLTEEQVTKLFKLSHDTSADSSVKIDGVDSAIWSNQVGDNIIAQESILKEIFDGNNRSVPLELRLAIPEFTFYGTKNDKDAGNLKLIMDVHISKENNSFVYSTESVDLLGLVPFDKNESLSCAKDRAMVYTGGGGAATNQIHPTVQVMFSPCKSLYASVEEASYDSGLMKSLVPEMFAGVTPSEQYRYGGWDEVLSSLALKALNQAKDLRYELDPSGHTKIVGIVADHLEALKYELDQTQNMTQSKDDVYRMGLVWSFKGQRVSQARMSQILQSVDNSIDTFKFSSERLLAELGRQPHSLDDQLSFARAIDSSYKTEGMRALTLSKDLSYSDFEREVFNQAIQKSVTIHEFKDWSTKLSAIKSEISKHSNISSVKGDLVGLSIKWLKSGEATQQDLGPVYSAINNTIVPFNESTKKLIGGLAQSLVDNREALDFARSLNAEYKQLATAILNNSKAAEYHDWGQSFFRSVLQKQPSSQQLRVWNEMWAAALAFSQREKARTKDEFGSTNEWNRKKVMETAIEENWSNHQFTGLETIAEVARAKNTCDRHKGYSSLADCGGLKLFSKKKRMFFDPSLGTRYVALGSDFAGYMSLLAGSDWTSLRRALVREFFGLWEPIWSKCDQTSFNQKVSNLKKQINAIVRETDQFEKWELERQIKDTLRNCQ